MINTLVTHKSSEGICCISKEYAKHYIINVGTNHSKKVLKTSVSIIDTTKCKTISFDEFKTMTISNNVKSEVIVGNELRKYVGIGWILLRVITMDDLLKYPRLI